MEHFLIHEMKIETVVEGEYRSGDKFFLKKYTTMIGVGGTLNLLFYVTYDESLLDHLTYKFAYGHVLDHEFQALRESAAGEIANTVIGHAISDFPDKGKGVAITPPVTIEDAKCINTHATQMLTVLVSTPYGNIELNVIGSSDEDQQC
jgi:chemotaxis protein CheX